MRSTDTEDSTCCSNSNLMCCDTSSSSTSCTADNESSLIIATYRPITCPITDCAGVLSPSTMTTHFEYMHRGITTTMIDMSQGSASINISLQYYKLKPMKPTVVSIILLQGTGSDPVPILLNMNLLPSIEYRNQETFLNNEHRSEWLVIWLSSLHLFPFLFTLTVKSYGLPRYSFSQQCSPISLHENKKKMNSLSHLEDTRAMLMNVKSMDKLLETENSLYVELKIGNEIVA